MDDRRSEQYLAIIGDLVQSRGIPNRAELQKKLLAEIQALNVHYAPQLAVPVSMTAGDEFEVLLVSAEHAVELITRLADAVLPHQLAFGIGAGRLVTVLEADESERFVGELDGPVFHRARSALNRASADGSWLLLEGFGVGEDEALSGLAELLGNLRRGWTAKQAAYVAAARHAKQLDVARRAGVGQSVVSESLKAARFELALRSEARLQKALSSFFQE